MTQITDEMVEAARIITANQRLYSGDEVARCILTAAYPLIRQQVLDEVAKVCMNLWVTTAKTADDIPIVESYNDGLEDCAHAIRDMKEKQS